MTRISKLIVKRYRAERIANPCPSGDVSFNLFHTVRNAVVRACQRHGTVGPLGVFRFWRRDRPLKDWRAQFRAVWEDGADDPDFWVIDDQYNSLELYQYMELSNPLACTVKWLESLTAALRRFPGWGVGVACSPNGYVLVFSDRVMINGLMFRKCKSARDVVDAIRIANL
jgi:hypothetical protein